MTWDIEDFDLSTVAGIVATAAALGYAGDQARSWTEPGHCHPGTSNDNPCQEPVCIARAVRWSGQWAREAAHHARRLQELATLQARIPGFESEADRLTEEAARERTRAEALEAELRHYRRRELRHLYVGGIEDVACGDEKGGFMVSDRDRVTCVDCLAALPPTPQLAREEGR